jgi:ApbE superfamily uncharacterized protein (UPF0280 family)
MSERVFVIRYKQTAIKAIADTDLKDVLLNELIRQYTLLEKHIQKDKIFLTSYEPVETDRSAPKIARIMSAAAKKGGVGPMAAVAGAFSDALGEYALKKGAGEIIIENGGDIFLKLKKPRIVGVHAGPSRFSDKIGFRVLPKQTPLGICTSSDSVGHSISLGKSDAVTVFADSAAMADAAASAIGNKVKGKNAVENGIKKAKTLKDVRGVLIIKGNQLGAYGSLPELIKVPNTK